MLDNIKMGLKLVGGFVAVAIIAAVVGGTGMFGLKGLMAKADVFSEVTIPSLAGLADT
jgi:methyl-accepting chemotaxis protein